jgi:hypothetical protein
LIFIPRTSRHHKTRLGCRLNAGGVEWVERHGCRESAVRTWMSVRRGPTERRRSEGTRRSRAQPGARTLGYLGSFQVTRRRRNSLAVRPNQNSGATQDNGCSRSARPLEVIRVEHGFKPCVSDLIPVARKVTKYERSATAVVESEDYDRPAHWKSVCGGASWASRFVIVF